MNKIKVIDLLNMISKGEEVPKKIKVFGGEFEFLYQSGDRTYFDYDGDYLFSDEYDWENNLNNEVEIIEEEKEIEKLNLDTEDTQNLLIYDIIKDGLVEKVED